MAHVHIQPDLPGVTGLLASYPETGVALRALADVLLHRDQGLSRAERELIAAFVSGRNDCEFCAASHGAMAQGYGDLDADLVRQVIGGRELGAVAGLSDKLRALLTLAAQVQRGGSHVEPATVEQARAAGATDLDIHDAVLIAAAFCMFNRYVDGLQTSLPQDPAFYDLSADRIRRQGYAGPAPTG